MTFHKSLYIFLTLFLVLSLTNCAVPVRASNVPPLSLDSLLATAQQNFAAGKYSDALDAYSKALALPTNDAETVRMLRGKRGEVYYLQRKYSQSLQDLEHANPRVANQYLSKIYPLLGMFDRALPIVSSSEQVKLKEASRELQQARSLCSHEKSEDRTEGLRLYARVLGIARECDDIRLERAECAASVDDLAIVREETNRIMKNNPDHAGALVLLARALYSLGSVESALANYKRVLKLDPDHKIAKDMHKRIRDMLRSHERATEAFANQKFADALEHFLHVSTLSPYQALKHQVANSICDCYVKLRQADDAIKACSEAEAMVGDAIDPILFKAEAYILKEDYDAAMREFQRAREKSPNDNRVAEGLQRVQRLQRMASRKDLYKVLGVTKTANEKEIKRAYRKLAAKYHPDKEMDSTKKADAEAKFREVNEAYETLTDPEKRRRYDSGEDLQENQGGSHGGHPGGQFFQNFFHGGGFGGGQQHFTFNFG